MDGGHRWATLNFRMACSGARRVCGTWSVRYPAGHPEHADRVFEELTTLCRALCSSQFSEDDGYTLVESRLSGPIEGTTVVATRADFTALVSVQRFEREEAGRSRRPFREIRVVASARHRIPEREKSQGGALTRWTVAGCAAGTMGLGAVALELAGLLTAWSQVLLLLPAMMALRTFIALEFARRLRRHAEADPRGARRAAVDPVRLEDLERWHRTLRVIESQREVVEDQFRLRPFRSAATLPGSVGAPAADTRTAALALRPSMGALSG